MKYLVNASYLLSLLQMFHSLNNAIQAAYILTPPPLITPGKNQTILALVVKTAGTAAEIEKCLGLPTQPLTQQMQFKFM